MKEVNTTMKEIKEFLDLKPGEAFADVGAGDGLFEVVMGLLVDSVHFYVQDIDTSCLHAQGFEKIRSYYDSVAAPSLHSGNRYELVIGEENATHLPDNQLDKIYTNGTFHVFSDPHEMLQDLHRKLKPQGYLYIRDEFANYGRGDGYCEECKVPTYPYEDFLRVVQENGFKLVEISRSFGNYPIHKFQRK